MTYRLIIDSLTGERVGVVRSTDGANIPFCEANCDYRDYLGWVAQGNTADMPS